MADAGSLASLARARALEALERERFDLVIAGGGITGAGVARDAALRGLRVALLEADDFAAGTSSRSSKLIHGGLRYLAMGEVALVRETARERQQLHRLAPHLAVPTWMVVPVRGRAGLLKFRAALSTYETLGGVAEADRHRVWGGEELAAREPALARERTPFACAYREYTTDDARLVLANLRAAAASGAVVLSRAPIEAIELEDGRARGAIACDRPSGRHFRVRARCVVNAAGPWVESLRRLEEGAVAQRLRLSKGVHVVVEARRLPVRNCVVLQAADRRSLFAIPRGRAVYLGTTDTVYEGAAGHWPEIGRRDVSYLLEPVARTFDVAPLRAEDCVAAWSGLRPLVGEAGKAPSEISRRDEVWVGPAGVVTVAGGKLTGYRKMAERVLARAAEVLGGPLPPRPVEEPPLPGGDFPGDLAALAAELVRKGVAAATAERLAALYGAEAGDVVERGPEPLVADAGATVLAGEVAWAVEQEAAASVEDLLYRRTRAALYLPVLRERLLEPMAERMGARLGWDAERIAEEVAEARARLCAELAFRDEEEAR
jgi:glycerol-3-phosphate dehydrogenase